MLSQFGAYQPHYWNYGLLCCLATVFISAPLFGIMGYYVASQLNNLVVRCLATVSFGYCCLATVFIWLSLPRNASYGYYVASQLYNLVIVASQLYHLVVVASQRYLWQPHSLELRAIMLPRNYYIITLPRNGNYITSLIIGLMGSPNLWNHGL